MSASELQALLRFLTQDAKIPLASAMSKVKELQSSDLASPSKLATAKLDAVQAIFADEKVAKQVLAAAKRLTKKRSAGDIDTANTTHAKKLKRDEALFKTSPVLSPSELEASLSLPESTLGEDALANTVLHTNRAPLVLAFVVTLLKHSMPEQPLSSRLSLSQAYVSITSRSRAVNLGIESGKSAEEEGFGDGQPAVTIMGKEIRILKRFGYEWRDANRENTQSEKERVRVERVGEIQERDQSHTEQENLPPVWALDLEALKKSENGKRNISNSDLTHSGMPIYTPQSARAYLLKSFASNDTSGNNSQSSRKQTAATIAAEKEQNLGKLLRCLDILYDSWTFELPPAELDKRTWGWYVKVRPDVADGVAGWGGKNQLKLANILSLRRSE